MKNINTSIKIIIAFLLGIIVTNIATLIDFKALFEMIQFPIYITILLYFLSFTLIEILIKNNEDTSKLQILEIKHNKNLRSLSVIMNNEKLLEGKDLFKAIYNTVIDNEDFKNFGYQKIIILSCTLEDYREANIHPNVLIDNDTPFNDYYNEISEELSGYNNLEYGYNNLNIVRFTMKSWNVSNLKNLNIKQTLNAITLERSSHSFTNYRKDKKQWLDNYYQTRSYSTRSAGGNSKHWSKGLITPLSLFNRNGKLKLESPVPIFTMDLETIKYNNVQVPIAISCTSANESKLFIIDHGLLKTSIDLALKQLWSGYFNYLEQLSSTLNLDKLTIFAHNLGDFDGYFLYKALMNHYKPDNITSIIDETNAFISIKVSLQDKTTFEWKDSLRIFPISLDKLCKVFAVEGKLIPYNQNFNSIELFDNPKIWGLFKKYSMQDSIALYDALYAAQF